MSLATPTAIRTLQRKLYRKAKAEPGFRFYLLYDKIYREDILRHAFALARSNAGAPGVDGVTFDQIEASGLEAWLAGLREELVSKTYRPDSVRRVTIPKLGGGERPLGIPTIRDRVVQTAAKLVLEPIFEADFEDSAYGYRPARGAVVALRRGRSIRRRRRSQGCRVNRFDARPQTKPKWTNDVLPKPDNLTSYRQLPARCGRRSGVARVESLCSALSRRSGSGPGSVAILG